MSKVTRQKRVTRLAALALGVFDQSQDTPVQKQSYEYSKQGKTWWLISEEENFAIPVIFLI